jgi:hypothetical protein
MNIKIYLIFPLFFIICITSKAQLSFSCGGSNCYNYPTFPNAISINGTLPNNCIYEVLASESAGSISNVYISNTSTQNIEVYLSVDRGNAFESGIQTLDGVCFGSGRDFEIQEKKIMVYASTTRRITLCIFEDTLVESDEIAFIKRQSFVGHNKTLQDVGNQIKLIIEDNDRSNIYNISNHGILGIANIMPNIAPYTVNQMINFNKLLDTIPKKSVLVFPEGHYYMAIKKFTADISQPILPYFTYEGLFYDNTDISYLLNANNVKVGYNTVIHRPINPDSIPFILRTDSILDTVITHPIPVYPAIFQTTGSWQGNEWFIFKGLSFDGDFLKIDPSTFFNDYDVFTNDYPYLVPGIDFFEGCHLVKLGYGNNGNQADSNSHFMSFVEDCNFINNMAAGYFSYQRFTNWLYKCNFTNCRKGLTHVASYNNLNIIACKFGLSRITSSEKDLLNKYYLHYLNYPGCGLWQEPNSAETNLNLLVESAQFTDGSVALSITKPNSTVRLNNVTIADRGYSTSIVITGNGKSNNPNGSFISVNNSHITQSNTNTTLGTYGNNQVASTARIQDWGGITFNNTHFVLNRYFINNSKDSNQYFLNKKKRFEPCINIVSDNCTRNQQLTFNHCSFTAVDSTRGQVSQINDSTFTTAFYATNSLVDISNVIKLQQCEVSQFDNVFYTETRNFDIILNSSAGLNCVATDTATIPSSYSTQWQSNNMPVIHNGYVYAGNNFEVYESSFTQCQGFVHSVGTNKFSFNHCFIDNMPRYFLKLNVPFDTFGHIESPFPNIQLLDCVSRQDSANDNSINIATRSSNISNTTIDPYIQHCISSNSVIYSNNINHTPYSALLGDNLLNFNNSYFVKHSVQTIGYNYAQSFIGNNSILVLSVWNKHIQSINRNFIALNNTSATLTEYNQHDLCKNNLSGYTIGNNHYTINLLNNENFAIKYKFNGKAKAGWDYVFWPLWRVINPYNIATSTQINIASIFDSVDNFSEPSKEYTEDVVLTINDSITALYTSNTNYISINIVEFDLSRSDCRNNFDIPIEAIPVDCLPPDEQKQALITSAGILTLYPNPSSGSSLATVLLPTALPSATLSISNVLGKAVYIEQLGPLAAGTQQWQLPIAHFAPGLYVVHLNSPTLNISSKLSIIKN